MVTLYDIRSPSIIYNYTLYFFASFIGRQEKSSERLSRMRYDRSPSIRWVMWLLCIVITWLELQDLSGKLEISWNHTEFEVRYECLSDEIKIGTARTLRIWQFNYYMRHLPIKIFPGVLVIMEYVLYTRIESTLSHIHTHVLTHACAHAPVVCLLKETKYKHWF